MTYKIVIVLLFLTAPLYGSIDVTVREDSVLLSSMTLPSYAFWGMSLYGITCTEGINTSAGPVIIKAVNSNDCYVIQGVNPNGTLIKAPTWIKCP